MWDLFAEATTHSCPGLRPILPPPRNLTQSLFLGKSTEHQEGMSYTELHRVGVRSGTETWGSSNLSTWEPSKPLTSSVSQSLLGLAVNSVHTGCLQSSGRACLQAP